MATTFNLLDLIFIGFSIIFVLTAFLRGFVKEIFALFNWVLAFVISYALAPYFGKLLQFYTSKLTAIFLSQIIIFTTVFIIAFFSTSSLCKSIKDKIPKVFDRSLGVLFGLFKTLLIFGFLYATATNVYGMILAKEVNEEKFPNWLVEAKCYNLIKISGNLIDPAVKVFLSEISDNFEKNGMQKLIEENPLNEKKDAVDDLNVGDPDKLLKDVMKIQNDKGYSKKDIEKMNRLIEIVQ